MALAASVVSAVISCNQPWMGLKLSPAERGLRVVGVDDTGPSSGILAAGDLLLSVGDQHGHHVDLQKTDIIEDPDALPTFKERNIFRDRQNRIHHILSQPVVSVILGNDRTVQISPQESRPFNSFPFSFWLLSLYAAVALLVGTAVWAVKQQSAPVKYLLLSGLGAIILLNSVKIISLRELALAGDMYPWLTFGYHLGNNLFAFGMIGLVCRFPKKIGRFLPVSLFLIVFMAFFMLNENFEWTELPGNSVLIQVPFYIVASMIIMAVQWRRSRDNPINRATVKVLILMIWILIFAISGAYFVNVVMFGSPKITLTNSFLGMFFVYVMFSLAVIRYRLFDIDRWWIEIWLWFFAGVAIIAFDVALVTLVDLAPSYAMGISVIIAAWMYFPVRQWLWGRFYHTQGGLENYVPLLVRHFVQAEQGDTTLLWKRVLDDVFKPLSIEAKQQKVSEAGIVEDGVRMHVPGLRSGGGLELYYAEKGRRLFNSEDVKLAQALFNIARSSMWQRESYTKGILDERKRIMRDLHDDIGGRLLTLTHSENDEAHIAAEALKSLREIIYSLDTEQQMTVNTSVAKWRIEVLERCELAKVDFEWHWDELENDIELTPRQSLNLTLVLREALSNALRHSEAERIVFGFIVKNGRMLVHIENDGAKQPRSKIIKSKGIRNMRTRVEELDGSFHTHCEAGLYRVRFDIPLANIGEK